MILYISCKFLLNGIMVITVDGGKQSNTDNVFDCEQNLGRMLRSVGYLIDFDACFSILPFLTDESKLGTVDKLLEV